MIKSDDSLREKLHISNEIFQKLTYFQMKSLNFILDNPPQSFLRAISTCSSSKLIKHLVHLNISLHAGEYPYNLFESYLRDIIVDWRIIQEDRIKLLNAISRNSATQIMSVPLFLGLWRALEEFKLNEIGNENESQDLQYSLQMLQLHFVDLHYIYSLIYDRLFQKIHPNQQIIRLSELLRLMTSADIRLTNHSSLLFEQSLRESGLLSESPENKIHIQSLFFISKSLKASQLEQLEYSQSYTEKQQYNNHNHHNHHRNSSTSIRYVQAIKPKWKQIKNFLLTYSRNRNNISYREFIHSIQSVGGTVMSPVDVKELLRYVAQMNNLDLDLEDLDNISLPIEAFDFVMKDPEVSYSSLSAIMRDNPNQPFCLKLTSPESPNKEDHVSSLLVTNESTPVITNINYKPIASPFPWHDDETFTISNVKRRIVNSINKSDLHQQKLLVRSLLQSQRQIELNSDKVTKTLPRQVLREAFIVSNIHVTNNDVDNFWDEMLTNIKSPVGALEMIHWMGLDFIVDEINQNQTQEVVVNSHNNRNNSINSTLQSQQYQSQQLLQKKQPISLSSFQDNLSPSSTTTTTTTNSSLSSLTLNSRLEVIQCILKNKAHLAFIFRTYGSGSGIVTGSDLCHALRQAPFSISLNDSSLWNLIYDIALVDLNTPKSSIFLRYNEVISYLEEEYERLTPSNHTKLQNSIKNKLIRSAYIRGSSKNLLSQLQILRQRLKVSQQRGMVTSWEGIPDMCSVREFITLCQTIDLMFTIEEVELIRLESRKIKTEEYSWNFITGSSSNGNDSGVKAVSIGGALSFLETLL